MSEFPFPFRGDLVVTLRLSNSIKEPLPVDALTEDLALRYPASGPFSSIETVVAASGEKVTSTGCSEAADVAVALYERPESAEVTPWRRILNQANRETIRLIVQELRLEQRRLFSGKTEWAPEGGEWTTLPINIQMGAAKFVQRFGLTPRWGEHLQALLDMNEQPSAAAIHLIEARGATDDRFAWIQATIAAELAIKEALSRLEPAFEVLLMEVPSPPLYKLYGPILERVAGERSPFVKELRDGAEVRNRLVHRPGSDPPTPQETVDYVHAVDNALLHLLHLVRRVYPEDKRAELHPYRSWFGREEEFTFRVGVPPHARRKNGRAEG